jgi:hypothetical protein
MKVEPGRCAVCPARARAGAALATAEYILNIPNIPNREGKATMTMFHAVAWVDHQSAQILQFDEQHIQAQKVKAHSHHTRQHGSTVRTEHEFYAELCSALGGIAEVLVTGSRTGVADFRHYVEKHRPATGKQIVGWEVVERPTDNQLVAMARKYFLKYDRMAGTPTPS